MTFNVRLAGPTNVLIEADTFEPGGPFATFRTGGRVVALVAQADVEHVTEIEVGS